MNKTSVNYAFYENKVIEYIDNLEGCKRAPQERNMSGLLRQQKKKNEITKNSKKNIEKKLTAWLNAIRIHNQYISTETKFHQRKPVFITLTLSDKTTLSHSEIQKQMLQNFIKQMRYNYNIQELFWKAELQKNGNLHYHLATDHYIPYKKIQDSWNAIQDKQGLLEHQLKVYGNKSPHSSHVRQIDDMEKAIDYVMKYVSKKQIKGEIKSRLYRFSKNFSDIKPFNFCQTIEQIPGLNDYLRRNEAKKFTGDFFTVIDLKKPLSPETMPEQLKNLYVRYYAGLYEQIYNC